MRVHHCFPSVVRCPCSPHCQSMYLCLLLVIVVVVLVCTHHQSLLLELLKSPCSLVLHSIMVNHCFPSVFHCPCSPQCRSLYLCLLVVIVVVVLIRAHCQSLLLELLKSPRPLVPHSMMVQRCFYAVFRCPCSPQWQPLYLHLLVVIVVLVLVHTHRQSLLLELMKSPCPLVLCSMMVWHCFSSVFRCPCSPQ